MKAKTNSLTNWLSQKVVPIANKFTTFKVIRAIVGGFRFVMPIIMIGAVFSIIFVFVNMLQLDPTVVNLVQTLYNLTFGLLGLILAFGTGYSSAQVHKINPNPIGLLSMGLFLVMLKPGFAEGGLQIGFSKLGMEGSVVATIAGVVTGEVCAFFIKRGWSITGKGIPDFIRQWFEPIIPGVVVLILGGLLSYVLNFDIYQVLTTILAPLVKGTDTLIGFVILNLIATIGWFLGLHTAATMAVFTPIIMSNLGTNAQLYSQGLTPSLANGFHITVITTLFAWVLMGGCGSFLTLNFLFLISKVKSVKALGRASIVPSLFCISEPILFGAPVAFNILLGIPMIIIQGLVNTTMIYLAMANGLVTIPFTTNFLPFLPNPIQAFFYNYDWRGVVMTFIIMAVDLILWYPFFRAYEGQMMETEKKDKG